MTSQVKACYYAQQLSTEHAHQNSCPKAPPKARLDSRDGVKSILDVEVETGKARAFSSKDNLLLNSP